MLFMPCRHHFSSSSAGPSAEMPWLEEENGEGGSGQKSQFPNMWQTGKRLLYAFSPVPDSPNRSHDRHLGTACLPLILMKQTNHGWIPPADAPIWRLSDLSPCTPLGSLSRGKGHALMVASGPRDPLRTASNSPAGTGKSL